MRRQQLAAQQGRGRSARPRDQFHGCDKALDARPEIARRPLGRDDSIEETLDRPLDHRDNQRVAVGEVHVESASRQTGASADRIETRRVEPVLGEGGKGSTQERFPRLRLRGRPGTSRDLRTA